MQTYHPQNIKELENISNSYKSIGCISSFYRGHSKINYQLLPNISRKEKDNKLVLTKEKNILFEFESSIIMKKFKNELNEFSISDNQYFKNCNNLIQAQHLEIHTRLLDWSEDFDIAKYFCANSNINEFGRIWIYCCLDDSIINFADEIIKENIFDIKAHKMMKFPSFFDNKNESNTAELRRYRQSGAFMIFPSENIIKPFKKRNCDTILDEIIISPKLKEEIRIHLKKLPFYKEENLFPFKTDQILNNEVKRINSLLSYL